MAFAILCGSLTAYIGYYDTRGSAPVLLKLLAAPVGVLFTILFTRASSQFWKYVKLGRPMALPPAHARQNSSGGRFYLQIALLMLALIVAIYFRLVAKTPELQPPHPKAFLAVLLGAVLLSLRVGMRVAAGQIRQLPAMARVAQLEIRAAWVLTCATWISLVSSPSLTLDVTVCFLTGVVSVMALLWVFDADSLAYIILRGSPAKSLTSWVLGLFLVRIWYDGLVLRWTKGVGKKVLAGVVHVGPILVVTTAFAAVPAFVADAAELAVHHTHPTSGGHGGGYERAVPRETPALAANGSQASLRSTAPPPKVSVTYVQLCHPTVNTQPGGNPAQIPGWAWSELHDNVLNKNADGSGGVGGWDAGCTGSVSEVRDGFDDVYYQVGVLRGVVMSVSLASSNHGGSIFLSDGGAEALVLSKLKADIAVSGVDRINVGNGDLVILYDRFGTTMLIRPTKHLTGRQNVSTSYTVLQPAEVEGWLTATQSLRAFLWPTIYPNYFDDPEGIGLSLQPYGPPVASVAADSATGGEVLEMNGLPTPVGPPEEHSIQYFTQFASAA